MGAVSSSRRRAEGWTSASAAFWSLQPAHAAQDATPAVELGNYDGRTLRMSVALAEDEARVSRGNLR